MKKGKTIVKCQECGYQSLRWMGRCPDCGEYNTMVEELLIEETSLASKWKTSAAAPQSIVEISSFESKRYLTKISEFDRVLGGGVVPGSLVLIGGEPGIGKSTLLLQVAKNVSDDLGLVLYVSGEESAQQVKMRAERLNALSHNLYFLAETDVEQISQKIEELKPLIVIIDSIQTMVHSDVSSSPGTVSQIRECTSYLTRFAKDKNISLFIAGHVTKEGAIAGPRLLEHMVDTVLYFEGDSHNVYRIIRAFKNRFGSTNEIGIFEMKDTGLNEVANPSSIFLSEQRERSPGSIVVATLEGTRPFLVEMQSLVAPSYFPAPRRLSSGLDYNRLIMVLAVLENKAGLKLSNMDVYVNVAGGVRVVEPAADLGVALAVASARRNIKIPPDLAVFGELGLCGEVRVVNRIEKRLNEIAKLGFKKAIIPYQEGLKEPLGIQIISVKTLSQTLGLFKDGSLAC